MAEPSLPPHSLGRSAAKPPGGANPDGVSHLYLPTRWGGRRRSRREGANPDGVSHLYLPTRWGGRRRSRREGANPDGVSHLYLPTRWGGRRANPPGGGFYPDQHRWPGALLPAGLSL